LSELDKKRYYWLKLKKDFFQQHQIKVLKALPNGRLYALIYMELLAESTSHDGELRYSKTLPYDLITLASVIDEDKDVLQSAIDTLVNLELVEVLEDKTIYMREINKLIGSETGGAERKRKYREISKGDNVPQFSQNCPLENRVKSKENRVKNIGEKTTRFIPPTLEQVINYCVERKNNVDANRFVDFYQSKNWYVGKNKMKDWKACVRTWERENKTKIGTYTVVEDKKEDYNFDEELKKINEEWESKK